MVVTPPSRSPWPLTAVLAAMLFVALVVAGREVYFGTSVLEVGDSAVNALQIDNAKRGAEIYGNYSRWEFNHPGPAFFYVYAAGEYLFHDWLGLVPTPHNAHLLASLAVQVTCFALALALVELWVGSGAFLALALLGGLWHFGLARGSLNSIWPPYVLLMPFLCFLAAACSVAAGRLRDLPVMVVVGGFLFHGHVAQPLFVGGLGIAAAWLHWRGELKAGTWPGGRDWVRAHRRLLVFCGAWTALFLLPLLIDVVRFGGESNVATILRRFLSNTQESKSILQSTLYFLSFPTYSVDQELVFTKLTADSFRFFLNHAFILLAWAVGLLVPAWLGWRWRAEIPERMRRFLGISYLLWGLTALLCVAWGLVQSGTMFQFNGFFYYGVYYYLGLLGLGILAWFFTRQWPATVTVLLFCLAAIVASWRFYAPAWQPEDAGHGIREAVAAALKKSPAGRPKFLVFEHYAWPEAFAVGLELQRRGIPFYNSPSWNFMVGRQHNYHRLSETPETAADVWWVAAPASGGLAMTKNLALFTEPAPLNPRGAELSFANRANGYRHFARGLATGNLDFSWSEEKRVALVFVPQPADADVQLVLDAHSHPRAGAPTEQPAEVLFNGTNLGTVTAGERNQFMLTVPKALWNQRSRAVLELRFPQAAEQRYFSRPSHKPWMAWGLWSVWFATPPAPAPVAPKPGTLAFNLAGDKPAANTFIATLSPVDGRIDFTKTGNLSRYRAPAFAPPGDSFARIEGRIGSVLFQPVPATTDVYLEIVAHPYADAGAPSPQRCQVLLNGQQVFNSPFTEPGVIRAIIPKEEWNRLPIALLQLRLPDATPLSRTDIPRQGLAVRWLTVAPQQRP
jgi:hypothetical protein